MEEIWKDIEEYEGRYKISNLGNVYTHVSNKYMTPNQCRIGYLRVNLRNSQGVCKSRAVHRLVAQAFIPNPENKPEVNHIDEDKTNNNVNNLEWMTRKENINHGTRTERMRKTQSIPIIATNLKTGESTDFNSGKECARELGLHTSNLTEVLKGRGKTLRGYTFKYKEV